MTTHEKDKILAAMKEAGFDIWDNSVCPIPNWIERLYAKGFEDGRQSVDTPVALAEAYRCGEEAGRQDEREECAKVCEGQTEGFAATSTWDEAALSCAKAIRARGEGK